MTLPAQLSRGSGSPLSPLQKALAPPSALSCPSPNPRPAAHRQRLPGSCTRPRRSQPSALNWPSARLPLASACSLSVKRFSSIVQLLVGLILALPTPLQARPSPHGLRRRAIRKALTPKSPLKPACSLSILVSVICTFSDALVIFPVYGRSIARTLRLRQLSLQRCAPLALCGERLGCAALAHRRRLLAPLSPTSARRLFSPLLSPPLPLLFLAFSGFVPPPHRSSLSLARPRHGPIRAEA